MILKLRARMDSQDVTVVDWPDASAVFRGWIEKNGYGASNLMKGAGDIVVAGRRVARVSYNGRLWSVNGEEIVFGAKP